MSFNGETWAWFKTAPLPVVLSLCLTSFMVLGSYAWSIDQEVANQKADVAVAAVQAKAAADTAKKMDEKLDKLLDAVQTIVVDRAIEKAEKAKKEKK